jgi:SAM-dependent methyltransferase
MDFSRGFLASTKAKGFAVRNYIHGNIVTGEGLSGLEGKYDFVLLEEVLEHLTAPYDALANINRILKPGGCVLLTVPNGGHWRQLYAQHVRAGQLLEHGPMLDTHIAELSLLGILKLIAMAGFVPLELSYYATRAPILKSLMSPQVGLVLQRECSPETRWQALAEARYQPPG